MKQAIYLRTAKESPENMKPHERCSVLVEDVSLMQRPEMNEQQTQEVNITISGLRTGCDWLLITATQQITVVLSHHMTASPQRRG